MEKDASILILGANGMVGKSLVKTLEEQGYIYLFTPRSKDLDLKNQLLVQNYMNRVKPEYVFFLAAKVGGIMANIKNPAIFGYDNLMMELNVINSAKETKVKKMLFMGSSCIYPRECPQPMKEEYLLTGPLEPTNEAYALAKIMGLKLCQEYNKQYGTNFISCMPSNIYGIHDNFDLKTSHVMSALIQKFHDAKVAKSQSVTCFGTGAAKREFINVKDVVDGCLFLMNNYNNNAHINLGVGYDISIHDLAHMIAKIVGFEGELLWDCTNPDGMPRKVLDVSKLTELGWTAKIGLENGIDETYKWFLKEYRK